ncbi:MAG: DUF1963 domain-containing protein [Bacteroidia bacterium]|nr:DUF1963 domain-containing protein [Bacteroidia bacterium]
MRKLPILLLLVAIFGGLLFVIYRTVTQSEPVSQPQAAATQVLESLLQKFRALPWKGDPERLISHFSPTLELIPTPQESMDLPPGVSHFGGRPDLPPGREWPAFEERPMAFLAQINLADYDSHYFPPGIPGRGILYVFAMLPESEEVKSFVPVQEAFQIIFYHGSGKDLQTRSYPENLPPGWSFSPQSLPASYTYTLPSEKSWQFEELNLGKEDHDRLWQWNQEHGNFENQLFGESSYFDDHPDKSWALKVLGFTSGEQDQGSTVDPDSLEREYGNLLSFGLPEKMGDSRMLLWLRKDDLAKGDLEKARIIILGY